jgi:fido (protein-threonine AMPylation protein)
VPPARHAGTVVPLRESPVPPSYDLGHLCAIHRRVFGDIYDWAGQLRTVAIAQGSWFCLPPYSISGPSAVSFPVKALCPTLGG